MVFSRIAWPGRNTFKFGGHEEGELSWIAGPVANTFHKGGASGDGPLAERPGKNTFHTGGAFGDEAVVKPRVGNEYVSYESSPGLGANVFRGAAGDYVSKKARRGFRGALGRGGIRVIRDASGDGAVVALVTGNGYIS